MRGSIFKILLSILVMMGVYESHTSARAHGHHHGSYNGDEYFHKRGERSDEEASGLRSRFFIPLSANERGLANHPRITQQPGSQGHGLAPERTAESIDRIVTHHTVSGNMPTINQVNNWWSGGGRNWDRAGYHFLIRNDGSIWQLVPLLSRSWGAGAVANPRSIHIAIAGNFSAQNLPSQAARDSYGWLVRELLNHPDLPNLNHLNHVTRHSDWSATNCSGFTTNQFRSWIPASNGGARMELDFSNQVFRHNGHDMSAVFDPTFYRNRYSDLRNMTDRQVFTHFVNHGMSEGRQAHADFNVHAYRNRYQDLRRNFRVDLPRYYMHFVTNGRREGRNGTGTAAFVPISSLYGINYSAVFDGNFYMNRYADLRRAFVRTVRGVDIFDDVGALQHFINNGMREGRQAHSNFNVTAYRNRYGDLQRAFGADLPRFYMHFITHGQREGRVGISMVWNGRDMSPVFDPVFYLNRYADLRRQNWSHAQAFTHFINHGMREGRQAHVNFNVTAYRNRHADLQRAFGNDLPRFYLHFITHGQRERRNARP